MSRYAVGDLQGCLQPLQCLLEQVNFDPKRDQLWLVGDLINRGPESLACLRFIKSLGDCCRIVLGNHDLHFLAVAHGTKHAGKHDTFEELLTATDRDELVHWLQRQPLMYSDPSDDFHMVHAGIPPIWSLAQAQGYAQEVAQVLRGPNAVEFFQHMYGNQPDSWQESLSGWQRLRMITNYFTRMRFCTAAGQLDFAHKSTTIDQAGFAPWFSFEQHRSRQHNIIFGHWASLEGRASADNVFALDTGCVWGRSLTLMSLEDKTIHSCSCQA